MCLFPNFEPLCHSISNSNCCFLACIQVSQEAGKVVWYCQLFKMYPQFVVIHTVKGMSLVNKAEVDVFQEFFCIFCDQMDVGNLISGSSAFSKSSLYICYWSLTRRILSITLVACETNTLMWQFEHYLALPFFGIGKKVDLFHCWVFQISCHMECNTLTISSLSIWNNLAGNPSPQIALFIVMLPKAHLTDVWL